jgi:glycosyltransferase involved in cell wall biosynthesis
MIFEAIGPYNAIGKIAASEVRASLEAGYRVSVVAHRLDESLRNEVEWLKLYNPPRGFALKWLTARHFIRRAIGERTFDVVHGHQPQIADLCDVFQCHFLTRVAGERGCLVSGSGVGATIRRWQQQAIVRAEDRYYRRWNPTTRMLFVSELIQREFERLYGLPPKSRVFENAAPTWDPVSDTQRKQAREHYGVSHVNQPIVGYLGGLQRRKGYVELLDALAHEPGLFLLMAGQLTEGYTDRRLAGRIKGVGLIDSREFLAACDVVIVPSRFDPCPMMVLEAAARGVPVIASEGVGNRATLLEYGAGLAWEPDQPLGPVVNALVAERDRFVAGCQHLVEERSERANMDELMNIYAHVRQAKLTASDQSERNAKQTTATTVAESRP